MVVLLKTVLKTASKDCSRPVREIFFCSGSASLLYENGILVCFWSCFRIASTVAVLAGIFTSVVPSEAAICAFPENGSEKLRKSKNMKTGSLTEAHRLKSNNAQNYE